MVLDNILSVDFDVETGICFDINVKFELVSRKYLILLGLRVVLILFWTIFEYIKIGKILEK